MSQDDVLRQQAIKQAKYFPSQFVPQNREVRFKQHGCAECETKERQLATMAKKLANAHAKQNDLSKKLAEADEKHAETMQRLELTIEDLWHAQRASQSDLKKSTESDDVVAHERDDDDGDDDDGKHEQFRQQSERLVSIYGEGNIGDVTIVKLKHNAVVDFQGLLFAFPRLVRNGAFVQVVSPGCQYRLEFRTSPRFVNGKCLLTLEECPDHLVADDSTGGVLAVLDSDEWIPVTAVEILRASTND